MVPTKHIKEYLTNLAIHTITCPTAIIDNNMDIIYANDSFAN